MTPLTTHRAVDVRLPDHTQLPESDGTLVRNGQELPQCLLLSDALRPVLQRLHPDANYCLGHDLGIYWRLTQPPEPPQRGAVAPDWFYVANVPRTLGGQMRRSYVLWQEWIAPLVVLEFVSGTGAEERDRTPHSGKFWIYEQAIRVPYYGIYEVDPGRVEVYQLTAGRYELMPANARGHFEIAPLEVELGIWRGRCMDVELPWLRWWDLQGNLLLAGDERAEQESRRADEEIRRAEEAAQRAEEAARRAEEAAQRAERLAAQLRSLGAEPET